MNAQVLDHVDTGEDLKPAAGSVAGGGAGDSPATAVASPEGVSGAADSSAAAATGSGDGSARRPEQPRQETVPHAALHEAREQNKALKAQIAALEARPYLSAEDADLLKDLRQQRGRPAEPQDPDFLQDPKGYVDSKVTRALKKLEEAETVTKETRQQVEQQSQFQQLVTTVQGHERTFAAATPDYPKALAHVRQVRESQLKLLYPAATPQQLSQVISREEIQGAQQALQSGQNPADVLYRYAQTLGYKPPEPAPAVVPAVPAPDKSAARSLGSGGGAGPTPADASEGDDPYPELTAALKERFGVARRR